MKLICYTQGHTLDIRPAELHREWMEETPSRYAYRCLPLNIANAHGWEIRTNAAFEASWNGGASPADIDITAADKDNPPAISHFGSGVLTFHVPCLFQTPPEYNLWVCGPVNRPKDGIQALTGVIETDWSPYGFTMNWIFTRPHVTVRFEKGEPFCFFFPFPRGLLETFQPEFRDLSNAPKLHEMHDYWVKGRAEFLQDLPVQGSSANLARWQRIYFQGLLPDDTQGSPTHKSKIRLRPFAHHAALKK